MEDRDILDLFEKRDENAIAETARRYERYCRAIAYRILGDGTDADEIVNDTYLKTWNTIPPHRPDSLKSYLGMICRQLSYDRYDRTTAAKRGDGRMPLIFEELSECLPDGTADEIVDRIALRDALNRFLGSLSPKTRKVFLLRYWYVMSVAEIGERCGMKDGSVRMQLLRTRKQLKRFLKKEEILYEKL